MPRVEGLEIDLAGLGGFPVAIGHGTYDDVIPARFGREAKERLEAAGADVLHREYPLPHTIDPHVLPELRDLVARAVPAG
jgi:predicted esterase